MTLKNQILKATSLDDATAVLKSARKLGTLAPDNLRKCERAFVTVKARLPKPARTVKPKAVTKTRKSSPAKVPRGWDQVEA